jgi:DnaJ-class molecular chaperone
MELEKNNNFWFGLTLLAQHCKKCGGTGKIGEEKLIPEASFKEHGGPVYTDTMCDDCKGHGAIVTEEGFQLMDFIKEFMGVTYARWLRN